MYAITPDEFTALSVAQLLANDFIPTWGCHCNLLSDNGLQVCAKHIRGVYRLTSIRKSATSSFHAMYNGDTERVIRTMTQILSCVVNERQDDWDV